MTLERIRQYKLHIASPLYDLVNTEILPGTGIDPEVFWSGLHDIIDQYRPRNHELLEKRNVYQKQLDQWHQANPGPVDFDEYQTYLEQIGYLCKSGDPFEVTTENVDDEVAKIAGPQLVVPIDNARYALNAANARWNSLYDAVYSSDIVSEEYGCARGNRYNPARGAKVLSYTKDFLDQAAPLANASHANVVNYRVQGENLIAQMADGSESVLGIKECFAGYCGSKDLPSRILLCNNDLHIELKFNDQRKLDRNRLLEVRDIFVESAITSIMDLEDSVVAVDAEDKVNAYRNWLGLMNGSLEAEIDKGGVSSMRKLNPDRNYLRPDGTPFTLKGRGLMFVRNVGTHIDTDMVTLNGESIPETFLDAMVTVASAMHDLKSDSPLNSRKGSIYVVKPKMHGPDEVKLAVDIFSRVEEHLGLPKNTVKIGIMDEERRTTVNLSECIRVARERVVFINTGFLDRTGDEIHSVMESGPMIPKNHMKATPWLLSYEDNNVEVGLGVGLSGRGQIGKGMWAAPDFMQGMIREKIAHPRSGASTAWVPSPTAATLHALHYHMVDVGKRQAQLVGRSSAKLEKLLTLPVMADIDLDPLQVDREIQNNAQGILGYVVRWINQGVGCSKVPDINDVALMEDRATLRISSQHIANWLRHGIVSREQVEEIFRSMAAVVDRQNAADPTYIPMSRDLKGSIAYQTSLDLVFKGCELPNGYTEYVLHPRRRDFKNAQAG
ncbi:MAG: malate synthase G [Gammaproteobacteria bacterium]|nr:malate synthase G [Gammaproteobacteria bacterium]